MATDAVIACPASVVWSNFCSDQKVAISWSFPSEEDTFVQIPLLSTKKREFPSNVLLVPSCTLFRQPSGISVKDFLSDNKRQRLLAFAKHQATQ